MSHGLECEHDGASLANPHIVVPEEGRPIKWIARTMSAVQSADGFDGPVDSRSECGNRRGNRSLTNDSKYMFMNYLQELGG